MSLGLFDRSSPSLRGRGGRTERDGFFSSEMVSGGSRGNVFIGNDLFPVPLPALEAETKGTGLSMVAGCRCAVLGWG